MKIKLLCIFLIITLLSISGCDSLCNKWGWFCDDSHIEKPEVNTLKDIEAAQKTVEKSSTSIKEASKQIAGEANNINTETTAVQGKVPEESKPEINPHLDAIKKSSTTILEKTNTINESSAELDGAKSLLDGAGQKVTIIETALDKMEKERDSAIKAKIQAEEQRDSALHKALRWLVLFSIVGAAVCGVFGFMYGNKLGVTGAIICVAIMSVSIFVEVYFIYLVIGGGILLAGLVGMLIYNVIIQKKAFKQVVETVEVTKNSLPTEEKIKIFGGEGQTGIMDSIQSPETVLEVKKVKDSISPLWSIAKNNIVSVKKETENINKTTNENTNGATDGGTIENIVSPS